MIRTADKAFIISQARHVVPLNTILLLYVLERFLRLCRLLPRGVVVLPVCLVLRWVRLSAACRGKQRGSSLLIHEICPYYSLVSWLPESGLLCQPYNLVIHANTQVHMIIFMFWPFPQPLPPLENRCLPDCSCETPIPVINILLVTGHQQQCLVWKGKLKGKQNLVPPYGIPCQGSNSDKRRAITTELNSARHAHFHHFLSQIEKISIGTRRSWRLDSTERVPVLSIPSSHRWQLTLT